jgi:tetratricopeptide (TPR) repeat protein/predicted aspartyl protease
MRLSSAAIWIVLVLAALPARTRAGCQIERYAQLPVTMAGARPLIAGSINGVDAFFIADSGSFFSALSDESARRLKLHLNSMPRGMEVRGLGGAAADARIAWVRELTLAGWSGGTLHNVDFVVIGNFFAGTAAGLIGQDVLGHADSEYDLGNGVIRLFHSRGCSDRSMAYWQQGGAFAVLDIGYTSALSPHLIGTARLNGTRIRVMFDTGAARSMLNRRAAARAGISTDGADVVAGGVWNGVGRQPIESWLARFDRLDLGGEQIQNARLRIGDIELPGGADLLLGVDFFLSHRIYVAASQHRVYFTYNGGRVFDLSVTDATAQAGSAATDEPPAAPTSAAPRPAELRDEPTDAAGFRRRGAAFAARRDFRSAIADLEQAIKLDPADPENYYQRALALWWDQRVGAAIADLDQALSLEPDYGSALMGRGTLRLMDKDAAGARADFDRLTALAPNDASVDLGIAQSYANSDYFDDAISRYDRWLATYPRDDRLPTALSGRCRTRALMNQGIDLALADCNSALRKGLNSSELFETRALVWLRLAAFDKAMADYQTALKLQPKSAWALYGRGLVELNRGLKPQADRDIQAAVALDASIADHFRRIGLTAGIPTPK